MMHSPSHQVSSSKSGWKLKNVNTTKAIISHNNADL